MLKVLFCGENFISAILIINLFHFSRGPPGEKGDTPKILELENREETIVGPYGLPGAVGDKGDRGFDGRDGSPGEPGN